MIYVVFVVIWKLLRIEPRRFPIRTKARPETVTVGFKHFISVFPYGFCAEQRSAFFARLRRRFRGEHVELSTRQEGKRSRGSGPGK